ncbi:MAG TPA: hypothetical protein VLG38_02155 [Gammaproteobacteria bacterium]|nr:hypothetical protein [Gammaproteobacteria bacterium]
MLGQIFTKSELLRILGKIDDIYNKNDIEFPADLTVKLAALRQDIGVVDGHSETASVPSIDGSVHDVHHELEGALRQLLQEPKNKNKLLVLHEICCILNDPHLVGDSFSNLDVILAEIKTQINDLAIKIIKEAPRAVTLQNLLFVPVLHDYLKKDARLTLTLFMASNPFVLPDAEPVPTNATLLQYQYSELLQLLQQHEYQMIADLAQQGNLVAVINYINTLPTFRKESVVRAGVIMMRIGLIQALTQSDELIGKWLFAQTPQELLGLIKLIDIARADSVVNSAEEKVAALRFEAALQQGLIQVLRFMPLEYAEHMQGLRELLDYLYAASNPLSFDKILFRAAMYELAHNHRHGGSVILDELGVKNKYGLSFTIASLTADAVLFCKRTEATLLQRVSSNNVTSFSSSNSDEIPEGPRERLLQG